MPVACPTCGGGRQRGTHVSSFVNTAETILVTETTAYPDAVDGVDSSVNPNNENVAMGSFGANYGSPLFGHFKMPNFLFADGHVKAMRIEVTMTPVNMWNTDNKAPLPSTTQDYKNLMNARKRLEALQ
jgi:prepilin-type processing-associated H-X9-DG protein